jgi:HlyD family secretion protein
MSLEKGQLDELRIRRDVAEKPRGRSWLVLALALLVVLGGGAGWWLSRPKAAEVRTYTIRESASVGGQKTVLNASGYVTARRRATVSSKVTGKVIEVLIEEGMKVEEGQVLARLDATNVVVSLRLAESQLQSAKAGLAETKVRLTLAQLELKRTADLASSKVSAQADLDRAQADVDAYKAHLEQQEADIAVAERQVAVWKQQLDDNEIRAPFSGIVVTKDAQPGEMISPVSAGGGFTRTGIGTVVDMSSLEVEVDVNESYINRVQPGQPVEATLDSYPDWQIPCKVIAIIPTADRQKATVKVRIGFNALDPRILPDMGVKVAFHGAPGAAVTNPTYSLPKVALRSQDGRDIVLVVKDHKLERRAVTVGGARGDEVTVVAGLTAGESVVVEGAPTLVDGDRVKVKTQ